jgi:isochorismate pyruvate lyase
MVDGASDRAVLAAFRAEIDAIDAEMVALVARRMAVVDRVVAVKREQGLPALIPHRVEDVAARVRTEAVRRGAPPDLAETLWRTMMAWVIAYEQDRLTGDPA